MHAVAHWYTYVPDAFDEEHCRSALRHLRRRLKVELREAQGLSQGDRRPQPARPAERPGSPRAITWSPRRRETRARPHARLQRRHRRPSRIVRFAACAQLESKVILGYLARQARASGERRSTSYHWRDLRGAACRRHVLRRSPGGRSPATTVSSGGTGDAVSEDRADRRPGASGASSSEYPPPAGLDTLRRVMRFAEALVARPK